MLKFQADYKAIAEGIYRILCDMAEKGEESYLNALAFGMLPGPLMEMAEKAFIEKMAQSSVALGFGKEAVIRTIKKDHQDTIAKFNKELSLAILRVAKENHNLVV